MPLLHTRSFGSLATLLDQQLQHPSPLEASSSHRPSTPDNLHFKPLPLTPQPSLGHASLSAEGGNEEEDEDDARSVATIMPAAAETLEPIPISDADADEKENKADRTRQWTEEHSSPQQHPERPSTPEPVTTEEPSPESSPEQHDIHDADADAG